MNHQVGTGGEMNNETGKQQRLLIVDDSRVIRVTARKILQDHFETVEAVDGENAWELLNHSDPFSLVVSDLTMPNLDGYGLLKRIRNSPLPQIRDLPVIVITGANDSEATKERATLAGATDFIGKPFDSVHLLARTQAHASAHTTTQALTKENIGLEEQLVTDPLTDLANDAAFLDRGYQLLSYAVRHKTSLAVLRVEIDDFGNLFKQHGKVLSNLIIKSVATILQSGIRHEDMAARAGTAQFNLLIPGVDTAGIRNLADRITRDISTRILKQGENRIRYTVSIGVANPEIRRDTRFDELLALADARLAHARARGGNQVIYEGPGAAVQSPQNQAPDLEQVSDLLNGALTEIINQDVDAEIQSDEIHIASVEPQADAEEISLDTESEVKARSTPEPDDLPSMFAGPIPELTLPKDFDPVQPGNSSDTAAGGTNFLFEHEASEEETIVITAPFDSYDAPVEHPARVEQMAKTAITDSPAQHNASADTNNTESASSKENIVPHGTDMLPPVVPEQVAKTEKTGIFRRLWYFLFRH
jgi:two-component system cell cycle response regulator